MSATSDTTSDTTTNSTSTSPADGTAGQTCPFTPRTQSDSSADRFMRRMLRLPQGKTSTAAEARSAFQKSLAFTTCRCLLMYIVFPFILPAVGIAGGVGPVLGIIIGILAMVSIVYSIRRFWRADHSKRWHYTVFGTTIIAFLVWATIADTLDLFD